MTQLDDLLQEVIEFSNLIAYSENPADPDLQHACRLFRDYLSSQLKTIRRGMIGNPGALHTRWSANELSQLGKLINHPQDSTGTCLDWIRGLFQYCLSLQRNRLVAA